MLLIIMPVNVPQLLLLPLPLLVNIMKNGQSQKLHVTIKSGHFQG